MYVTAQSLRRVFTRYKLLRYYFITILLSYLTYLEAKEEAGQQQCCPASSLAHSLARRPRLPSARSSEFPSLLLRPPVRLSSLPAIAPLIRPPFYLISPPPAPLSCAVLLRRPWWPVPLRSTQPCLLPHCRQWKRRRVRKRNKQNGEQKMT